MSSNMSMGIDEPHGFIINILVWFLIVTNFMVVATRVATKWVFSRKFEADDATILLSLMFSVGQTAMLNFAVTNGLGRDISGLSASQIDAFQKAWYASDILWTASQCASKTAMAFLIRNLFYTPRYQTATWILVIVTALWGVSSIVVIVFQCHVPQVWDFLNPNNKCINQIAFWNYSNTVNIVLELLLVVFPSIVVRHLQVAFKSKVTIVGCFATRTFTIAAIIWQMAETNAASLSTATNLTYSLWLVALAMSVSQSIAIVTACVPYLKPFIQSLESGMIRSDDIRRRAGDTSRARTYNSNGAIESQGSNWGRSVLENVTGKFQTPHELQSMASVTAASVTSKGYRQFDQESQSSRSHMIREVKTFTVSAE